MATLLSFEVQVASAWSLHLAKAGAAPIRSSRQPITACRCAPPTTIIAGSSLELTAASDRIRTQLESWWLLCHDSLQMQFGSTLADKCRSHADFPPTAVSVAGADLLPSSS
jgi:hypothetical protein